MKAKVKKQKTPQEMFKIAKAQFEKDGDVFNSRKVEWQDVVSDEEIEETTTKLKVEGGWLYLHQTLLSDQLLSESMCFVPEP